MNQPSHAWKSTYLPIQHSKGGEASAGYVFWELPSRCAYSLERAMTSCSSNTSCDTSVSPLPMQSRSLLGYRFYRAGQRAEMVLKSYLLGVMKS